MPNENEIHDLIQTCDLQPSEDTIRRLLDICEKLNERIDGLQSVPEAPHIPHTSHADENVPGWEYATTEGPRKGFDEHPPDGEGWERNTARGENGWERFNSHEEAYWRRKTPKV